MSFQELIRVLVPTKRISRNFDVNDLRSGHFRGDHYKAMGKCSNAIFSERTSKSVVSISRYSYIGPFWMIHMQFWPIDLSFGSFEVIWGQIGFWVLTFERIEIERWERSQSVSFAKTNRMICNMTYLSRHVTSRDLDLSWNFEIDLFRSPCAYFDERNTMLPKLCLYLY